MIRVRQRLCLDRKTEEIAGLVNNFSLIPSWLPGVTGVEVLASEGDISVVEIKGPRMHGGRLVLECVQTSPGAWVFSEADRYRGRGLSGGLEVTLDEGRAVVDVVVNRDGPFFDVFSRRKLRRELQRACSAFVRRADDSNRAVDSSVRRKVFEIVRRDGALYVVIDGRSFELSPDIQTEAS